VQRGPKGRVTKDYSSDSFDFPGNLFYVKYVL